VRDAGQAGEKCNAAAHQKDQEARILDKKDQEDTGPSFLAVAFHSTSHVEREE
jgi:hypothetical protein